jgi:hypothetical protein
MVVSSGGFVSCHCYKDLTFLSLPTIQVDSLIKERSTTDGYDTAIVVHDLRHVESLPQHEFKGSGLLASLSRAISQSSSR